VDQTKQPLISFPEKFNFKPSLGLYLFPSGYFINLLGLWIKLGIVARMPFNEMCEAWGISYVTQENALIFNFGKTNKVLMMPWDLVRVKCYVLTNEASFQPFILEDHPHHTKMLNQNMYKDDRAMHEAPFIYLTKKGVIQKTTAYFYVTTSYFKWRIFKDSNLFKPKVTHEINVTFKNEIGNYVGTHLGGRKGGTFEMIKEDLSPFHTLARINRTQIF
jgi:hypothetical protein